VHNGSVEPLAKPPTPLNGGATGEATADAHIQKIPRPPQPPAGRPTFLMSKGMARTSGKVTSVRRKELLGLAAGLATTYARLAMTRDLVGLAQGLGISAHLWPAQYTCIVIDYALPVVGAQSAQRFLSLCQRHLDARLNAEKETLVESTPLEGRVPCDDCNPWYSATWEVVPADNLTQPVLLPLTSAP
jgi:hypothetical protein